MSKIDLRNYKNESTSNESDFFIIPEGETKLRVLTDFVEVKTAWSGEYPNSKPLGIVTEENKLTGDKIDTKGWAWAIIRSVNGAKIEDIKIVKFGAGILNSLAKLKNDLEYEWADMPMPFDITISNSGNGPARYTITPARSNVPVTADELTKLDKKKPIEAIIQAIVDKQGGKSEGKLPEYEKSEITPDDIDAAFDRA